MSIEHGQKVVANSPISSPAFPRSKPTEAESHSVAARILTACLFWSLCLTLTAAGHRLYKATVLLDRTVSASRYQNEGAQLTWVGYGSLEDAYMRLSLEQRSINLSRITSLPNSSFWIGASVAFTVLGGALAWAGRWVGNDGIQSLMGVFAGHFLWLGAVEFGLDAAGRRIGLASSLEVVGNKVAGTHGTGTLIQLSVVFLVPILIGLTLHESNRCALFQWFRQRLPLARTAAASGRVENYAARTAIQYFMTVWFCYVGVLWLADQRLGRLGEIALWITMLAIIAATPYMIWRTVKQSGKSQALRYSVSGAVVTWTAIEIAAAMHFFEEPWLDSSFASGAILLALTVLLTALVFISFRVGAGFESVVPRGTRVCLTVLVVATIGCSSSNESEPPTVARLQQQLDEYDGRIRPPNSAMTQGLLRALSSNDPEMRAQAATAFGKARRVSRVVKEQLKTIALTDESRLSQCAALIALKRLRVGSPEVERMLNDRSQEKEWSVVVKFIRE